jgi:hypothetical protein
MASKSAKNGFAFEAGNRECGVGEHPMYNCHWFEEANLEYAGPVLNPPVERTTARAGEAPLGRDGIGTESGGRN